MKSKKNTEKNLKESSSVNEEDKFLMGEESLGEETLIEHEDTKQEVSSSEQIKIENNINLQSKEKVSKYPKLTSFFKNLCFYLKFAGAPFLIMFWLAIFSLGIVFFNNLRLKYVSAENLAMVQSCVCMIVIFSAFILIATILFGLSIYLNIKRHKEKGTKK